MRKLIFILFILLATLGVSSCADPSVKTGSSQDVQRSHAQGAQDELSTEVHK